MLDTSLHRQRARAALQRAATATFGRRRLARIAALHGRAKVRWQLRRDPLLAKSTSQLRELRDVHSGETAVILGNGPSLNQTNLDVLRDVPTFGLNRIYLKFPALGFSTTYLVCVNDLVVRQSIDDLAQVPTPTKFCDRASRRHMSQSQAEGFTFLRSVPGPFFATDPARTGIWQGATVTYVAMQLAYHLGFSRVLLVGVDHRFRTQGPAHKAVTSQGQDRDHFDANYFGKGFVWQLPDLHTSELAYRMAQQAFTADGREIIDCTVGGALTVFPKSTLESEL